MSLVAKSQHGELAQAKPQKCANLYCPGEADPAVAGKRKLVHATLGSKANIPVLLCKPCKGFYHRGNFCHYCHQIYDPDAEVSRSRR